MGQTLLVVAGLLFGNCSHAAENWFLPYEEDEHTLVLLHLDAGGAVEENSGRLPVEARPKGSAGAGEGRFGGGAQLDGATGSVGLTPDEGLRLGHDHSY